MEIRYSCLVWFGTKFVNIMFNFFSNLPLWCGQPFPNPLDKIPPLWCFWSLTNAGRSFHVLDFLRLIQLPFSDLFRRVASNYSVCAVANIPYPNNSRQWSAIAASYFLLSSDHSEHKQVSCSNTDPSLYFVLLFEHQIPVLVCCCWCYWLGYGDCENFGALTGIGWNQYPVQISCHTLTGTLQHYTGLDGRYVFTLFTG